jgi:hypothetical protein
MKYLIFFLGIVGSFSALSQSLIIKKAKDYRDTIRIETLIPSFLFICPTDYVNTDSVYNSKLKSLIRSDKRLKSANIILAFYKPLMAANKPHLLKINSFDSVIELKGTLQCIVLNFPCGRIDSTLNRSNLKSKYWFKNFGINTTEILIYDNMCPQNLGERLHYYNSFMEELILPKYSEKEEIEFLKQSIINLERKINDLEELIKGTNNNLPPKSQILDTQPDGNSKNEIKRENKNKKN